MQNPRRNRVGCKNSELWSWEIEDIRKMTGPLAVQEFIQELIRNSIIIKAMIPATLKGSSRNLHLLKLTSGNTSM